MPTIPGSIRQPTTPTLEGLARLYRAAREYERQTYRLVDEAAERGEVYDDAQPYPTGDAAERLVRALRAAELRYVTVDGEMFIDASPDVADTLYLYETGHRYVVLSVPVQPMH